MSAKVEPEAVRKFLAWCTQCSEGYRATRSAAQKWADKHNKNRHQEEGK